MPKDNRKDEAAEDRGSTDPGPATPDPAPWLGQVGEGATEPSGEAIARTVRELTHPRTDNTSTDKESGETISADPEMPIPNPD